MRRASASRSRSRSPSRRVSVSRHASAQSPIAASTAAGSAAGPSEAGGLGLAGVVMVISKNQLQNSGTAEQRKGAENRWNRQS